MSESSRTILRGRIVEEEVDLTLVELCQTCGVPEQEVSVWVLEGILEPSGDPMQGWRFGGASLRRAQQATRLARDLGINPAGVALALDLLDRIETLDRQLKRRAGD